MRKLISKNATTPFSLCQRLSAATSFIVVLSMLAGCNTTTAAQGFANVITGILNIAKAETPALPPADAAIIAQWTTLGTTLDAQLQTCITSATAAGGKKAAFLACFNTFAAGIASPTELAQLRVLSSGSQNKVQLWVTAIILGVNAALTSFGGVAATPPQVAAQPASRQELVALAQRLAFNHTYGL
ncbi:MAG TPA: hypothetical protein VHX36_06730 [Candidatus Acidoferrales bacterium]|nr:hypothetical protein [Candidatus Acidoferrales bacterium]